MILVPIIVVGVVLALLCAAGAYMRYNIIVPPDEVAVFTSGKRVDIVHGGARVKKPVVERVDKMSLAPFELEVQLKNAVSKEGVAVNVEAVALIRFDATDEGIKTAASRFLKAKREQVQDTIQRILSGHFRSICAKMTVEEINGNREILVSQVRREADTDFAGIGMTLDVLTIQHITDEHQYLENLGRARIAQIKSEAEIGEALAVRDATMKSAIAQREGAVAQAQAEAEIAEANKDRDIRKANAKAESDRAAAIASQAGPQAEAQARRAVITAEVAVEEERVKAEISVEQQRALREEQALQATVVKPAEARRAAAIVDAEGQSRATIVRAEAESQAAILTGKGAAEARTLNAGAHQAELVANAEGQRAQLLAEAEGKDKLAEALKKFNEAGLQLTITPQLIEQLPAIVAAASAPLGNIDKVVMIDSGGSGKDGSPMNRFGGQIANNVATAVETLKAVGIDLTSLIPSLGGGKETALPEGLQDDVEAIAGDVERSSRVRIPRTRSAGSQE